MSSNKRLGTDPLAWIKNSKETEEEEKVNTSQTSLITPSKKNESTNTSKKGLAEGLTRATFIIKEELLEKIKQHSYWERKSIKDIIEDMIETYFHMKRWRDFNNIDWYLLNNVINVYIVYRVN